MTDDKKHYVGITIGPIFETIEQAISPMSMWFSSYFFSTLTKTLCSNLSTNGFDIFSPYWKSNNTSVSNGVGRYHDRILGYINGEINDIKETLDRIISDSKKAMAQYVQINSNQKSKSQKDFLDNYLQIKYIIISEEDLKKSQGKETITRFINAKLDVLEHMLTVNKPYRVSPFKILFQGGNKANRNSLIKENKLSDPLCGDTMFYKKDQEDLRDIEDIANPLYNENGKEYHNENDKKYRRYYAVINSDGDNMSKLLNQIGNDSEKVKCFSKKCLEYIDEAYEKIRCFGGMLIYGGGDDLLFLTPIKDNKNNSVFSLCKTLNDSFECKMHKLMNELQLRNEEVSLSFGVSIHYTKFPLYEAFQYSRDELSYAKKNQKNRIAFRLQKHSGSTIKMTIPNDDVDCINKFIQFSSDNAEVVTTSVIYTLEKNKELLKVLEGNNLLQDSQDSFISIFCNFFDNPNQNANKDYYKKVGEFYFKLIKKDKSEAFQRLMTTLLLSKFLKEK